MKKRVKFIIYVYLSVLGGYLVFVGFASLHNCHPYKYYRQAEEFSFNRASYFVLYEDLENVLDKNMSLLKTYTAKTDELKCTKDSLNRVGHIIATYFNALPEAVKSAPKYEILRIERVASADIMNSPAYYNRSIHNNVIRENGQGADDKTVCLIYLNNGEIIQAGLENGSCWLGIQEGERVLKTTSLKMTPRYVSGNNLDSYTAAPTTDYQPLY